MLFQLALSLYLISTTYNVLGQSVRKLGGFDVDLPGFSNFYENRNVRSAKDRYDFLVNSFLPIPDVTDYLNRVKYIGRYLDNLEDVANRATTLTSATCPRRMSQVPLEVFGTEAIAQPDGFVMPGKRDGSIKIIDLRHSKPKTYDITSDPFGNAVFWFYHDVTWKDMNGDGRLDAVTARVNIHPDTGAFRSQMIWLEHPLHGFLTFPWQAHVIASDIADTYVQPAKLNAGGRQYGVLATIGYFNRKLTIFWTEEANDRWDDLNQIKHRVIDTERFFNLEFSDVNKDGRLDLLVTKNAQINGEVYAYEIPDDFRTGAFTKHVLASGFDASSDVQNAGAPGSARAIYPNTRKQEGKPLIVLSGDDEGTAYVLYPNSQATSDWSYRREKIFQIDDSVWYWIVGNLATADVDGDGWQEIFLSAYGESRIHVFTFAPATSRDNENPRRIPVNNLKNSTIS